MPIKEYDEIQQAEPLPVIVLIRTSGRPKFYANMMASIREQTYPKIETIVHIDDPADMDYVKGTANIIVQGRPETGPEIGSAPYNLYCNTLLDTIPDDIDGWFYFLDDDDMFASPDALERMVESSKKNCVNVARSDRGEGNIWPKFWRGQNSFQTECFLIHTAYKGVGRWWSKRAGDHHYSKQLTEKLSINWIDNLIIARAQQGKNRGARNDLAEPNEKQNKNRRVPVYYLHAVKKPVEMAGNHGDIKLVPYRFAEKLVAKRFAKMLDSDKYNMFISDIMLSD